MKVKADRLGTGSGRAESLWRRRTTYRVTLAPPFGYLFLSAPPDEELSIPGYRTFAGAAARAAESRPAGQQPPDAAPAGVDARRAGRSGGGSTLLRQLPERVFGRRGGGLQERRMRLKGVSFANWIRRPSHAGKDPEERWLREWYPWPVLARVECGESYVGMAQSIRHDRITYEATLQCAPKWQPRHGTFKYRMLIESEGLGWHSRAFSDRYDMCGTPDGSFVTVFHTNKREPLERIARSFLWTAMG